MIMQIMGFSKATGYNTYFWWIIAAEFKMAASGYKTNTRHPLFLYF